MCQTANCPSISVVIPTYNCGHLIQQALDSVLAQTFGPKEIIVVDDGSKDDTRESLKPYRQRISYLYQDNNGVSAARNRGIREAQGDFIAFLDADDVWHPRKLEFQMKVFAKAPSLALLCTGIFDWPVSAFPIVAVDPSNSIRHISWPALLLRNDLNTPSIVVRRDVLGRIGGFDEELRCAEDRDLWLRIGEISEVAKLDEPLTGVRQRPGSLSTDAHAAREGGLRLLRKLDERRAWQGHWLSRRKAYSLFHYRNAYVLGARGKQGQAVMTLLKSFAWYPFAYRRSEVRQSLARPKSLAIYLLRMLGLKKAEALQKLDSSQNPERSALDL